MHIPGPPLSQHNISPQCALQATPYRNATSAHNVYSRTAPSLQCAFKATPYRNATTTRNVHSRPPLIAMQQQPTMRIQGHSLSQHKISLQCALQDHPLSQCSPACNAHCGWAWGDPSLVDNLALGAPPPSMRFAGEGTQPTKHNSGCHRL